MEMSNKEPTGSPVQPLRTRFERRTDDLRLVREARPDGCAYISIQRRFEVEDGEPKHVLDAPPPPNTKYRTLPGQPLVWVPIRDEWRDIPTVDQRTAAPASDSGQP